MNEEMQRPYCPYCGEDYYYEKISSTSYYDGNGNETLTVVAYWCKSCNRAVTVLHDNAKISQEIEDEV